MTVVRRRSKKRKPLGVAEGLKPNEAMAEEDALRQK